MCISRFPSRLPKFMNSGRVHKTDSCGGLECFRNSILWPFSKEGFRSRLLTWMQAFIMGSDFVPGSEDPEIAQQRPSSLNVRLLAKRFARPKQVSLEVRPSSIRRFGHCQSFTVN
jgi:hypothetical protein